MRAQSTFTLLIILIIFTSILEVGQIAAAQGPSLDQASRLPDPNAPQPAAEEISSPSDLGEVARPPLQEPEWDFWTPAYWDPWEGNVELGMNGTDGNTETFNIRFGMTAKHTSDWLVRTLQVTSIQKRASGATTANTALIDGRLELPMPQSKWNYFIHGLVEYDQFKAFDTRLSADTGFGYEFIQNDVTTLTGRSGLSVSQEIGGDSGKLKPEVYMGGEYKHKFNATHQVTAKIDYYPNVSDVGDFRLNSQAAWEMALSQAWGLSLKFAVIDRYDSTPQGARPNDVDYSTLLLWTF